MKCSNAIGGFETIICKLLLWLPLSGRVSLFCLLDGHTNNPETTSRASECNTFG